MAHTWLSAQSQAASLIVMTAFALWLVGVAISRRQVPGAVIFAWLMAAVACWTGMSAVHRLLTSVESRTLAAQFQYLGIASVPVLWFLFCRTYASRTFTSPVARLAIWVIPALEMVLVATNSSHHLFWTNITPVSADPADGLIYEYGPVFWVAAAYGYLLVAAGTWDVVQFLREQPRPYRSQSLVLAVAATVPAIVNVLYLAKLIPDFTPMSFAFSGGLFGWSLFRQHLLDLPPIARGMLFDRLTDAVFVLDPEYRILDLNAKARKVVGSKETIGNEIARVLPWWSALISGETRHPDRPAIVETGEPGASSLDVAVTPVTETEGTLAGWLVVIRDVTQRRREEEERRALDRRLQEQQHVESLTLMAGGLAHDFNNLLTGIMGNADLLAMKLPADATELRDLVRTITVGSERAADLVAKMQTYSGAGGEVHVPVDIAVLSQEMVVLLRASVAKHCQLVDDTARPLPSVSGDPTQLRQVLLNLVVNAAEAVEAAGRKPQAGIVTVRTAAVAVPGTSAGPPVAPPTLAPGRYLCIDVADNGSGMDDLTRTRMFDPFFSTKDSGRGLGLASVLGIVRSHHGSIGVHSVPGQGTTVRIWLPVA